MTERFDGNDARVGWCGKLPVNREMLTEHYALFVADNDYLPAKGERVWIESSADNAVEYACVQETGVSGTGEVWVRCHSEGWDNSFQVPLRRVSR